MKRCYLILGLVIASYTMVWGQDMLKQRVDLQISNASFQEVLYQLIEQEGTKLSFRNELLPTGTFSFSYIDQPLRRVLNEILAGTALSYRVIGDQVLLIPRPEEVIDQYYTISGFVSDAATGESLIGANIIDIYSQQGTVSNEYGFFSLNLPRGWIDVRISYLGYENQQITLELAEIFTFLLQGFGK